MLHLLGPSSHSHNETKAGTLLPMPATLGRNQRDDGSNPRASSPHFKTFGTRAYWPVGFFGLAGISFRGGSYPPYNRIPTWGQLDFLGSPTTAFISPR